MKVIQNTTRILCHRNFGIGADGILVVSQNSDNKNANYKMSVFNSDGSLGKMCGNGLRCVAAYIVENKRLAQNKFYVATDAGDLEV